MDRARRGAFAGVSGADGAALWLLHRAPEQAVGGLGHPRSWFAAVGSDRAVATLAEAALWLAAAWVALGLACLLARRPGTIGGLGASFGRVLLPRVLIRLVAGSAGLGVLVAPVAATAHPPPRPAPASAPARPGPMWPSSASAPSIAGPRWPTEQAAHPPLAHPPPDPRPAANPPTVPAPSSRPPAPVRVSPGDSLWLLAAQRLGPHADDAQIAAEWPRWYAANRQVIGADPDHIVPGQVLHAPAASSEER